jgi:LAO/AO transport system kinase
VGIDELASRVRSGDRRALSRAISWIEDQTPAGRALLDRLYDPSPRAHRLGVTGPPGSGKSTLVSDLTQRLRARRERVGILAVDPSSPFTGGAILGDRIRMQAHSGDPGVFIRSMASRGSLGGLATTTYEASEALEAAGFEWVLIETVGVGQSEMEIIETADTTLLVLVPESGDGIQVMKAGLMEAGDVFVINKYDREGGDRLQKEIALMLEMEHARRAATGPDGAWERVICPTVANQGTGVQAVLDAIERHKAFLRTDAGAGRSRIEHRIETRLRAQLRDRMLQGLSDSGDLAEWVREARRRILAREASPYGLVDEKVKHLLRGEGLAPGSTGKGTRP